MRALGFAASRLGCALLLILIGCAHASEHLMITVAVEGTDDNSEEVFVALETEDRLPITVERASLPREEAPETQEAAVAAQLQQAAEEYFAGNFGTCLTLVPDDGQLLALLSESSVRLVGESLHQRMACLEANEQLQDAREVARTLARWQLPRVGFGTPQPSLERLVDEAMREIEIQPRVRARIEANIPDAAVAIDGHPANCHTPCELDLPPGNHHVLLTAEGFAPTWRLIEFHEQAAVFSFELEVAHPSLAGQQWWARYGREARDVETATSLRLLLAALRTEDLLLYSLEPDLVRAALARSETSAYYHLEAPLTEGSLGTTVRSLARRLLEDSGIIRPVWKSAWFWVVVGVGVAATVTAISLLATRIPQQQFRFRYE